MLEVRLCLPDVTALPQSAAAFRLLVRSLDTRARGVLLSEFFGFLVLASLMQRFVVLPRLQPNNPQFQR